MAIKILEQLFIGREAQPGVVVSGLLAAAYAKLPVIDPKIKVVVERNEREIIYGSLDPLKALIGKTEVEITFACELAGDTAWATGSITTTAPLWGTLLEACGNRAAIVRAATWSGVFTGTATGTAKVARHGDLWQTASAAKVIRILHDTYESTSSSADSRTLYYEVITGSPATSDVFYPSSSDGTVGPLCTLTGGAPNTNRGLCWFPTSLPIITMDVASISGTHTAEDTYKGGTSGAVVQAATGVTVSATSAVQFRMLDNQVPSSGGETFTSVTNGSNTATVSTPAHAQLEIPTLSLAVNMDGRTVTAKGCRGTYKITCERGKPVKLEFTFRGAYSSVSDGGPVASVTRTQMVPPRWQGVSFKLGSAVSGEPGYFKNDTAHSPRIVSASFDMGGEANLQEDATQTDGTGGVAHLSTRRKPVGAMKIDVRPEATFPLIKKLKGGEPFRVQMRISDTGNDTGNTFLFTAPGNVATGADPTDTNNFNQDDVSFDMSGLTPTGIDAEKRSMVLMATLGAGSANNW